MHVFEVESFEIGMADFCGVQDGAQRAVPHDADACAGFLSAKQIVRRHQDGYSRVPHPKE
jgi:hypothetical protein